MGGKLIIKRDPVTIGAVVIALIGVMGGWLGWSPVLIGALIAVVSAVVGVVQALNVFGTDKFVAVALNLVGAGFALAVALNVHLDADLVAAMTAAVAIVLGLFARNGVTNRLSELGGARSSMVAFTSGTPMIGPITNISYPMADSKSAAAWHPGTAPMPEDHYTTGGDE
jgi:HAMP domain-containing protein